MDSNRQVLVATYKTYVPFIVPKGIDLNAPGVEWSLKWNELVITLADGTEITVECAYEPETDYKYASETSIEKGEDWEHLIEEDEEKEAEKAKGSS
jgi:hypothetical protein